MATIITADRVSGSFTSTGSLGQLSLGGTSTSGSIQPSSSLHMQGESIAGGIHMFTDAFPNQYGMRYYLVDSGADGQYLRFDSQRNLNYTEVLRIGHGGNASNPTLQLVTGNLSGSLDTTGSFGQLLVRNTVGQAVNINNAADDVALYSITAGNNVAKFESSDGTATIVIEDNSSTGNSSEPP